MKKMVSMAFVSIILISSLLWFSCKSNAKSADTSQLLGDYKELESSLSLIRSFPSNTFTASFEEFQDNYDWDYNLSNIPDGVYETYSTPDRYNYVHYLKMEIKDHQFENIYYNEYLFNDIYNEQFSNGGEEGKRGDESYYQQMVSYGNDAKLWDGYAAMEEDLLESQDPQDIDGITGASLAVNRFRILIMKALYEYNNSTMVNDKEYEVGDSIGVSF